MTIKKFIEVPEEIFVRLAEGKCVQGSIKKDPHSGKLVFKPHNIAEYVTGYHRRQPDKLLIETAHGWVKESPKRIKYYCAVKKALGVAKVSAIMEQDLRLAISELIGVKLNEYMNLTDEEIIDRV